MALPPRVLERVEKLLRLAAPSSGTSEAERASAALEAAKLISENALEVKEKPTPTPPRRRRSPPPPPPPPRPSRPAQGFRTPVWDKPEWTTGFSAHGFSGSDWRWAYVENRGVLCVVCKKEVYGEAWYDPSQGYRCHDITCDS